MNSQLETQNIVKKTIGEILLESGKINPDDADKIVKYQAQKNLKFGDAALKLKFITQEDIDQAVAKQFDFSKLSSSDTSIDKKVIAAFNPISRATETIRAIRSQLNLRWFDENKSLVIAPVEPKNGSSFIASNLAVLFSQLGLKTILIDADLRSPSQSSLFKTMNKQGLSDIIAKRAGLEVINNHHTLQNLFMMSSGTVPPNPLELLSRPEVSDLIQHLESLFDVILIDSPAMSQHCDGTTLSSITKGILLVTKKNKTSVKNIKKIQEGLSESDLKFLSIMINYY